MRVCRVVDSNLSVFRFVLGGVFTIDLLKNQNRLLNIKAKFQL